MAYKTFANGFPLPASDLNNYLMNQSVIVFADVAARAAALPTPVEGMITYLESDNLLYKWTGADWELVSAESPVTTEGDLIVGDAGGDETRLAIGTTGQILTSNGTTATWADNNALQATIFDAEGDLIYATGADTAARLPRGTDGQVLTATATSIGWETISAGGLTVIASGSISGSGSITSIPGTYKYLALKCSDIGAQTSSARLWLRVNNDTTTNYNHNGIAAGSAQQGDLSYYPLTIADASPSIKKGVSWTLFHDYATSDYPTLITHSVAHYGTSPRAWLGNGGYWNNNPITSIQITSGSANAELEYVLYGVN